MELLQSYPFRCFMVEEGITGIMGIIIDIISVNNNGQNKQSGTSNLVQLRVQDGNVGRMEAYPRII